MSLKDDILLSMDFGSEYTSADMSEKHGVCQRTAGEVLNGLVDSGLVSVRRCDEDNRVFLYSTNQRQLFNFDDDDFAFDGLEQDEQASERKCLQCKKMFMSTWIGNRRCPNCKESTDGIATIYNLDDDIFGDL